jgi:hypothetical protein
MPFMPKSVPVSFFCSGTVNPYPIAGLQVPVGVDVGVPAEADTPVLPDLDAEHVWQQPLPVQATRLRRLRHGPSEVSNVFRIAASQQMSPLPPTNHVLVADLTETRNVPPREVS